MREINTKELFERIDRKACAYENSSVEDKDSFPGHHDQVMRIRPYTPPSNVADWLALNKVRPVDPPRKRDMSEGSPLWNAALRPPAAWCDWNGPSSDPTIKHAGAQAAEISCANCGTVVREGEPLHLCAAPAPAPVADFEPEKYEPIGTVERVGDRVQDTLYPQDGGPFEIVSAEYASQDGRATFRIKYPDRDGTRSYGQCGGSVCEESKRWRILKRKNVAARAWKENGGKYQWLCIGKRWYSLSPYSGWSDYGDNFLWGDPMTGWSELTDPAEIQRLVRELRDAGLGT